VVEVGQRVDHGDRAVLREPLDLGLGKRTDHDGVHVPRQNLRGVSDGLTAAHLHPGSAAGRQRQRLSAELVDSDLERDAGACRLLGEDHRDRLAGEPAFVLTRSTFDIRGELENSTGVRRAEVEEASQMSCHVLLASAGIGVLWRRGA
jgi:hypothetical protein